MKSTVFTFLFFLISFSLFSQNNQVKVGCIGFYNLENLFDTLDTPDVRDSEFTPDGSKLYNTKLYREKLDNLARVVSDLGKELTPDGVAILGVSEIENRSVLEDFVRHPKLVSKKYQIVHYDSPDERGIDVGLIYQPKYFKLEGSKAIPQIMKQGNDTDYTRDVLHVWGKFDGEDLHILVNHWPSRGGGEANSSWKREASAAICKNVVDSLQNINPDVKVIIMGDLNDDPISPSVAKVLDAKTKPNKLEDKDLYNPMYAYFKKGIGTLAWRDSWNLFDQIILSSGLMKKNNGYHFYKARVFNEKYLQTKTGRWKGYPWRTFSGDNYIGGFSDHFPVYVFLVKNV